NPGARLGSGYHAGGGVGAFTGSPVKAGTVVVGSFALRTLATAQCQHCCEFVGPIVQQYYGFGAPAHWPRCRLTAWGRGPPGQPESSGNYPSQGYAPAPPGYSAAAPRYPTPLGGEPRP